jgi:hypothetical protein
MNKKLAGWPQFCHGEALGQSLLSQAGQTLFFLLLFKPIFEAPQSELSREILSYISGNS